MTNRTATWVAAGAVRQRGQLALMHALFFLTGFAFSAMRSGGSVSSHGLSTRSPLIGWSYPG